MRAVLIDDEKLALAHIAKLIEQDARLELAAQFTSSREAILYLRKQAADIVFLDIEMPGINGLETADHIRQAQPGVRIVFITAYSQYALEAFELRALDYLLKPVHPGRFRKTVSRIMEEQAGVETKAVRLSEPQVTTFGQLAVASRATDDDGRRSTPVFRTQKAQELFAYLLHHKDKWIDKDQLLEMLWPGGEYDKQSRLLHTSVYQIRKLIKDCAINAAVEFALNSYRLTDHGLMLDRELFEQETAMIKVDSQPRYEAALLTLNLYTGDYLQKHEYEWAAVRQDELRRKYSRLAQAVGRYEAASGRETRALDRLLELHVQDPYSDEICLLILQVYERLGDRPALRQFYQRFEQLLRHELNTAPSEQVVRYVEGFGDR